LRSLPLELSVLSLGFLASGALAAINLPGPGGDREAPFAIMFAPWTSPAEAAMASWSAGLRVIRAGALPFVVVVAPSGDAGAIARPDAALLMLRLDGVSGCGVNEGEAAAQ
jgi:hypothetical protein